MEKAKEILHERFAEPVSLGQIAGELGVTPVYLTSSCSGGRKAFRSIAIKRACGSAGPCCCCRTARASRNSRSILAYSSHAHFTTTFSTAFRITPKAFRASRHGGRPQESSNGSDRDAWPNA